MPSGLEGFVMLLPWGRKDRKRNEVSEIGILRWFQWGYITHYGDYPDPTAPKSWYILIALPSYLMKATDYGMGDPVWHQRYLLFRGQLPSGKEEWEIIDIECQRTADA